MIYLKKNPCWPPSLLAKFSRHSHHNISLPMFVIHIWTDHSFMMEDIIISGIRDQHPCSFFLLLCFKKNGIPNSLEVSYSSHSCFLSSPFLDDDSWKRKMITAYKQTLDWMKRPGDWAEGTTFLAFHLSFPGSFAYHEMKVEASVEIGKINWVGIDIRWLKFVMNYNSWPFKWDMYFLLVSLRLWLLIRSIEKRNLDGISILFPVRSRHRKFYWRTNPNMRNIDGISSIVASQEDEWTVGLPPWEA